MLSFVLFILRLNYKPKLHHRRLEKPPPAGLLVFCPWASVAALMPRDVEVCLGLLSKHEVGKSSGRRVGVRGGFWKPVGGPIRVNCHQGLASVGKRVVKGEVAGHPARKGPHQCDLAAPRCLTRSHSALRCPSRFRCPTLSFLVLSCP